MRAWLCLLLLILSNTAAARGIPRWDALPAVDVEHLQGPYAGRSVCPMCQHGYDAGILVFVPVKTTPLQAGRIAQAMQSASAGIDDPRFRPFLIFTGGRPSPALQAAVKGAMRNWYVGLVPPERTAEFSRDFQRDLGARAWGYVFAQRRLLWSFEPLSSKAGWQDELARSSRYAMQFLQSTYAKAVASNDPDTPKGPLWSAPSRLDSRILLSKSSGENRALCFAAALLAKDRDALVGVSTKASPRVDWARIDKDGCVLLQGRLPLAQLRVELFRLMRPMTHWQLETTSWNPGKRIDVSSIKAAGETITGREPVVGQPCENCELVFRGMPSRIDAVGRIAPPGEPGQALRLSGTVRDAAGRPRAGIVVYAYQTDHAGRYPAARDGLRHGRLRGWARSDTQGRYELLTVRPGGYPGTDIPQHIHMHVIEPGRCTYYLSDVFFADDPRLTAAFLRNEANARGGEGVVRPSGDAGKGWNAVRDISLGKNVPGYSGCVQE